MPSTHAGFLPHRQTKGVREEFPDGDALAHDANFLALAPPAPHDRLRARHRELSQNAGALQVDESGSEFVILRKRVDVEKLVLALRRNLIENRAVHRGPDARGRDNFRQAFANQQVLQMIFRKFVEVRSGSPEAWRAFPGGSREVAPCPSAGMSQLKSLSSSG